MKQVAFFITLLLTLIFIANPYESFCQTTENQITVLFVDKTTSAKTDAFIEAKNQKWLKKIIKKHAKSAGDEILVSYLFGNSASVTNVMPFSYRPPKMRDGKLNSMQKKIEALRLEKRVRSYKKSFGKKIYNQVFTQEVGKMGSNIVGSFTHLVKISKAHEQKKFAVYYLSDMKECSDFRKMYCEGMGSIDSYEAAKQMAEVDFVKIKKKYALSESDITGFKRIGSVSVILPAGIMDIDYAFEFLPIYWEHLFGLFGVTSITFY